MLTSFFPPMSKSVRLLRQPSDQTTFTSQLFLSPQPRRNASLPTTKATDDNAATAARACAPAGSEGRRRDRQRTKAKARRGRWRRRHPQTRSRTPFNGLHPRHSSPARRVDQPLADSHPNPARATLTLSDRSATPLSHPRSPAQSPGERRPTGKRRSQNRLQP
jgi:hypothetical protein